MGDGEKEDVVEDTEQSSTGYQNVVDFLNDLFGLTITRYFHTNIGGLKCGASLHGDGQHITLYRYLNISRWVNSYN